MNFCHKTHYGKDFFYPTDTNAMRFVDAFPHSSGKRKSLTLDQLQILKEIGAPFVVREQINIGDENDTSNRTNQGLRRIPKL